MANSTPTNMHDDDEVGCCPCLFGKKRSNNNNNYAPNPSGASNGNQQDKPTPLANTSNTNNNNSTTTTNSTTQPVVNKLQIPSIVTQVDRDQVGVNSPRAMEIRPHARRPPETKISLLPPQKPGREGRKCLVLDLDETLVHSSFQPVDRYDFLIPVEIDGNVYQVCLLVLGSE
jgi:TFIIF-interacting CTD phosphatase-like protein